MWSGGPCEIDLLRDESGEIAAFQMGIWLDRIAEDDARRDPGVVGLHRHLSESGLLESEGRVYYSRFWMAIDSYHAVSATAHAILDTIWGKTLEYQLALGFFYHTHPDGYMAVNHDAVEHWDQFDFSLGGRRYGVLGHDYRHEPIMDWVKRTMLKAFAAGSA